MLLVLGFAVKLGIVPLHVWLPLAHPVAPSPASAVLSGLLVKAGLLGMLRFVPPQSLDAALWLSVGFFTAAYGVLAGLLQSRLKTVLAYSTVSQMGLALAAFAAVQVQASVMVVGVFALHHGLNKIALFLGSSHRWPTGLHRVWFVLPAAALAGLPFTSGMLAKTSLKGAMHTGGLDAGHVALTASSVTTTVLLMHALRLAREQSHGRASPHPAWICASLSGFALPWSWAVLNDWFTWDATAAWDALWPVALGVAIYGFGRRHLAHRPLRLPEGDLVVVAERLAEGFLRLRERLPTLAVGFGERYLERVTSPSGTRTLERAFASTSILGVLVLCLMLGLWLAR